MTKKEILTVIAEAENYNFAPSNDLMTAVQEMLKMGKTTLVLNALAVAYSRGAIDARKADLNRFNDSITGHLARIELASME